MNSNDIFKDLNVTKLSVVQKPGIYGIPRPKIDVTSATNTHYRKMNAALARLRAEVELATPPGEHWCVGATGVPDPAHEICVYLELAHADAREVRCALEILRAVKRNLM